MKKLFLIALCAFMCIVSINAQVRLHGSVIDSETGKSLPQATIYVKGLNIAASSDNEGDFTLKLKKQGTYTLELSYVGYHNKSVNVDIQKDVEHITIKMTPSVIKLGAFEINSSRVSDDVPFTYTNIDKKMLDKISSGHDLPILLDATPSLVSMSDNGSGIGYTDFKIRGTDMNRINITVNGIPLNDAESQNVFFANMPDFVSSVDNVQIQRGVGTSTDGTAAFGATVNFKTKEIENDPYGQVTVQGGSFNTLRTNVQAGTGLMDNKFSFNIGASKIISDGYIDRAFADMKSIYLDGAYVGNKFYAKIMNYTGKQRTYQAWFGVDPEKMKTDRTYNPAGEIYTKDENGESVLVGFYDNEIDDYKQSTTHLMTGYHITDNLKANLSLHYTYGTGYYESYKNNQKISKYQINDGDIMIGVDGAKKTNLIRQKWLENHFYGLVYSLNYKIKKFDMILGGGYNRYIGDHFGKIIWAEKALIVDKTKNYYFSKAHKNDFNIYYKINYAITNQWSIYGDVQYRNIVYTIDGIRDDMQDITQAHNFNFINPKAGVVWQNEGHRGYVSFAMANREPNRDNFADAYPDVSPKSEKLFDYEAGYKYHFNRAMAGASLYFMDYKDQLVMTGEINNVGDPIMVNVPVSYRMGIELEGSAEIIKDRLRWVANLTLSRNKIKDYVQYVDNWNYYDDPDNNELQIKNEYGTTDISFSPSIVAYNRFTVDIFKGFSTSIISKFVGKQYIDNCSDENQKLNPYFLTDVKFEYDVPNISLFKDVNLFVSVNNVLNTKYETKAWLYRYYYDNKEDFESGYFPQAGINVFGGVTIRF